MTTQVPPPGSSGVPNPQPSKRLSFVDGAVRLFYKIFSKTYTEPSITINPDSSTIKAHTVKNVTVTLCDPADYTTMSYQQLDREEEKIKTVRATARALHSVPEGLEKNLTSRLERITDRRTEEFDVSKALRQAERLAKNLKEYDRTPDPEVALLVLQLLKVAQGPTTTLKTKQDILNFFQKTGALRFYGIEGPDLEGKSGMLSTLLRPFITSTFTKGVDELKKLLPPTT